MRSRSTSAITGGASVRPAASSKLQADITKLAEHRLQTQASVPQLTDIAEELDADVTDVSEAMAARGCFSPSSLDQPVGESRQPLGETIRWDEPAYSFIDDWVTVGPLCRQLSDDDRELLRLRFVEDKTQQEIADLVGVSQMQVSRRLAKVLDGLRTKAGYADAA
ncbi:sigma-70 family RNA polymerase sigma factor [Aeromicrobium sp. UC242_57]